MEKRRRELPGHSRVSGAEINRRGEGCRPSGRCGGNRFGNARRSSRARVLEDTPSRKRRRAIYRPAKRGACALYAGIGQRVRVRPGFIFGYGHFPRSPRDARNGWKHGRRQVVFEPVLVHGYLHGSCGGGRRKIDAYGRFIADLFVVGASQYGIERLRWSRARLRARRCVAVD